MESLNNSKFHTTLGIKHSSTSFRPHASQPASSDVVPQNYQRVCPMCREARLVDHPLLQRAAGASRHANTQNDDCVSPFPGTKMCNTRSAITRVSFPPSMCWSVPHSSVTLRVQPPKSSSATNMCLPDATSHDDGEWVLPIGSLHNTTLDENRSSKENFRRKRPANHVRLAQFVSTECTTAQIFHLMKHSNFQHAWRQMLFPARKVALLKE